ncbi:MULTISPECIES: kelch repeat-containing protein [unclassified Pseudomonas]|uniref:Kelch repeat-containing protein n=1 Tax=unclassified Pseudomonas TaxID=196821 RepID=UPI000A1DF612|nr:MULTISPECIES: kelch repeat-containing protein [unclassified Pseudomonas]
MNNTVDGSFVPAAPMNVLRAYHSATVLPDGDVLVVGGTNGMEPASWLTDGTRGASGQVPWHHLGQGLSGALSDVERYSPSNNAWTRVAVLPGPRLGHRAVCLNSGQVMVIAGSGAVGSINGVELYSPATDQWVAAATLETPRFAHTATLLDSGHVMVCGGNHQSQGQGQVLASVEIYDPVTNRWRAAADVPFARMDHTATLLASGKLLVLGGYSAQLNAAIDDASLFDPATGGWSTVQPLPERRMQHTATRLADGRILVVGGADAPFNPGRADAYLYDPQADSWSLGGTMVHGRKGHSVTRLASGHVLVIGDGLSVESGNMTEVFDPDTHEWAIGAELAHARFIHTASLLPGGQLLVAAGLRPGTSHPSYLSSTERLIE